MRLSARVLAVPVLVAALATLASARSLASSPGQERAPGRYVVVLHDQADADRVANEHARAHQAEVGHVYRHALRGYSARMSERAAAQVAQDPRVQWVEPDKQFHIAAQPLPTGINRIDAELSPTARINGLDERVDVDVAVIDTGIDLDHSDLNVYRAGAKSCSLLGLQSADDDHGHGTHVAGTIGALDNARGVVGVAPGARVWPVKVLNSVGIGFTSDIVCGIDYVTSKSGSIEVANMSLGGSGSDDLNCGNSNRDSMHRAICRSVAAGITYAVAAGNNHADSKDFVPAAYDEVITVSALADFNGLAGGGAQSTCRADADDTFADFSNYGRDVDVIAPGVCINSTWSGGGYNTASGTSMAAPHVAGAAALYKATHAAAGPSLVRIALQSAGNLNWIWPSQDPDGVKERLANVASF